MLILAIETSTPRSSVALVGQDGVVADAALGVPRRHGEFLVPAIVFLLAQSGRTVQDVTGVAVGLGPGLYTGLRVGIATAITFASARGLPAVGLSGLDVLAFQARHVRRVICSTIDARRGELFWGLYRQAPGGVQRESELRVGSPDTLAAELQGLGEPCLVLGDAARRHAKELAVHHDIELDPTSAGHPLAADLGTLALPRFVREETERALELRPIYLRTADAKIGWEQRGRLRGGADS